MAFSNYYVGAYSLQDRKCFGHAWFCALLGNSRFPRDTQDLGTLHSQILMTTGVLGVSQTGELLGMLLSSAVSDRSNS